MNVESAAAIPADVLPCSEGDELSCANTKEVVRVIIAITAKPFRRFEKDIGTPEKIELL
jgi:hypothetical protein